MRRHRHAPASLVRDAAQREASAEESSVVDDEPGGVELQLVEAGQVRIIEKISRQRLDTHWDVLKAFLDFSRSDDDFRDPRRRRRLGERRCRQPQAHDEDSREQPCGRPSHDGSPSALSPSFSSRRYIALRERPSASAAAVTLPPLRRIAERISARSASSRLMSSSAGGPAFAAESRRSAVPISSPAASRRLRSTTLWSSRTFPGHAYCCNAALAPASK